MLTLIYSFSAGLFRTFVFALVLTWLLAASATGAAPPAISVQHCLERIGKAHRVFFTIEQAYSTGVRLEILGRPCPFNNDFASLAAALTTITNALTNFTLIRASSNSPVYHLIDSRLAAKGNYPLNATVDTFSFEGNVHGLITTLAARVPGLLHSASGPIGSGPITVDASTYVKVRADGFNVRQLLTDFLPLTNYHHVIWASNVSLETMQCEVKFTGQASRTR